MEKELFFNHYTSVPQTTWNWEVSMDQNDPFEPALSSIVSSPVASSAANGSGAENFVIGELMGRLGSICNSGEVSPHSYIGASTNTSCYNTPLNSPPKLNLSTADPQARANFQFSGHHLPSHPNSSPFSTDPGLAERAARFSCFNNTGSSKLGGSREESTLTEQNPGGKLSAKIRGENNSRKRKSIPKGETKESKRTRQSAASGNEKEDPEVKAEPNEDITEKEPPKDYIHVRARRGQATDSHSLAERVRREKISQRMKFLQDLVPGCNQVTGKAVMLDEIITYVQSLQSQVEFLSMKLATINPRMDATTEGLLQPFSSGYQALHLQAINASVSSGTELNLPMNIQGAESWADDLQSVVQMGYDPNQQKRFHGSMAETQMKAEVHSP